MKQRIAVTIALVILILIGALFTLLATSEVQQMGVAAGVRYTVAHGGLHGYTFANSPTGFRFEQRLWFGLGRAHLQVAVEQGRVLVNGIDRGSINAGDDLTVTSDGRILLNDLEI